MAIAPTEGAEYEMGAGQTFASFDGSIGGPSSTSFKWRCYGDAMGAWGNMVTNGANLQAQIAKLGATGSTDNFLDVGGADFESQSRPLYHGSIHYPRTRRCGGKSEV